MSNEASTSIAGVARVAGEKSKIIGMMPKADSPATKDGSSGGSYNFVEAKRLTQEIARSRQPRQTLEHIAHPDDLGKDKNFTNLKALSHAAREKNGEFVVVNKNFRIIW